MKFYITTPLYYVNDVPHIGHAYTTIAADAFARYHRIIGDEVFFLTGTDEHGQKIEQAAAASGETPMQLADRVVERFKELWKVLGISFDRFIRTTDKDHEEFVRAFYKKLKDSGDIYLGEYEGWYCVPCETFYTDMQIAEGKKCPSCGREVSWTKEPSYFFRMSKYTDRLIEYIESNPDFIQPVERRNEVLSFVREGLRDLSISRTSFRWGIPVPDDEEHVIYVWFDALLNYLSGVGCTPGEGDSKWWPADLQLIGKDILRHHAVYWSTFLMSAGIPLPAKIFAHGWWTVEGDKMSKSKGNVIDPLEVCREFGVDAFRYFVLREMPFGVDGDFSRKAFVGRLNGELANDLGNLVHRTATMVGKYCGGRAPMPGSDHPIRDISLREVCEGAVSDYRRFMESVAPNRAAEEALRLVRGGNRFIDDKAPWVLNKEGRREELNAVLADLLVVLKNAAVLFYPFIPSKAEELWSRLGEGEQLSSFSGFSEGLLRGPAEGASIVRGEPLFPRVDL